MTYPLGVVTRTITVGDSLAVESGTGLTVRATLRSSRGLVWVATGERAVSAPEVRESAAAGEAVVFTPPVTDQAGWRDLATGALIDVSTPHTHTHTYTIELVTLSGGRPVDRRVIGPFPLPTGDGTPVDADLLIAADTVPGLLVSVPDSGPQGPKGDTGQQGPQGPQGPKGDTAPANHNHDGVYVKTEAVGGLLAPLLVGATAVIAGTTPIALDAWGGYTWGAYGSGIYRSSDNGETWALYATAAAPSILRLLPTSDGEVVVCDAAAIRKSTGWSTGSPTWTTKVAANGTCQFQSWGFDGDSAGSRFIATDYSSTRADSRYVRMSLDAGDTWSIVYDSVAVHGATLANASHMHGVCRDDWGDRWYFSEGHDDGGAVGDIAGIYCSEDDGATWTRAKGMRSSPAPTVLVATADGLVCGSDSAEAGLFGVERRDAPAQEQLVNTWRWRTGRAGVIGFGKRGYRQPGTGQVYVAFTSVYADVAPVIAAGTPTSGALVYTWPGAYLANDFLESVVLPSAGRLLAYGYIDGGASRYIIKAHPGSPGARSVSTMDTGGALGGSAVSGDSMALGPRATTGETPRATAVGIGAAASTTQDGTAVGYVATAGQKATALGSGATAASYGTSVGMGAMTNVEGVAVGAGAQNTSTGATAVGRSSKAGNGATAVGQLSTASGSESLALGYGASATHTRAVSLRDASTSSHQVQVGARHIELKEVVATPAVAPVDSARLYLRDNGSGKTQLVIQFPSGAALVIATEP